MDEELLGVRAGHGRDWAVRVGELAVFPVGVAVPVEVVACYWEVTGGWTAAESRLLCAVLGEVGLAGFDEDAAVAGGGSLRLADAVGVAVRRWAGDGLVGLQRRFLDAVRDRVGVDGDGASCWWDLAADESYLWGHLTYHLAAAGGVDAGGGEWDRLLDDLRWVVARLERSGPAVLDADLARSDSRWARRLRERCAQIAHLLAPVEPGQGVAMTLLGYLDGDTMFTAAVARYRATATVAQLVAVWPLRVHPALLRTLPGHTRSVNAVAIAPDGSWLAGAGSDRASAPVIVVWDLANGGLRAILTGHTGTVNAVAIAPDGSWLASASNDQTVRLWNADGTPRASLTGHTDKVTGLAIAPDGSWLASASDDRRVLRWDVAAGHSVPVSYHSGGANAVAIAPDGSWLASTGGGYWSGGQEDRYYNVGTVILRNLADGSQRELTGHTGDVNAVAIAPDGSWLASAGSDGIRLWNADGTPRATGPRPPWWRLFGRSLLQAKLTDHTGWMDAVAIAPDGSWLASISTERTVRLWNADGTPRATLTDHTGWMDAVAIAPDGSRLASTSRNGTHMVVRLWAPVQHTTDDATGHTGRVNAVAAAPDGSWLASAGDDRTVRLWNADGTPRATLTGHTDKVNAVAIAPDGSWLASTSTDRTVRLWNADGTPRATLPSRRKRLFRRGFGGWNSGLAIAPDGSWLASAGDDHTVRLWNADGTARATLRSRRKRGVSAGKTTGVAIAPDGTWLAVGSYDSAGSGTIRLWNADGAPRATLTGHTDWVNAVTIAPDGSWLAGAADRGHTVWIWDSVDGSLRTTLTGHTDEVRAVAIAPDGTWLAGVSDDGTVRVWDSTNSTCTTLIRLDSTLTGCAIFPDSQRLAVCGSAGITLLAYQPARHT